MKKGSHHCNPSIRGPERIRTAVEAFAELCLATRPQDPLPVSTPERKPTGFSETGKINLH